MSYNWHRIYVIFFVRQRPILQARATGSFVYISAIALTGCRLAAQNRYYHGERAARIRCTPSAEA